MLRFDEEAHVQITKEDFRQVKSQVPLVIPAIPKKQTGQVDPNSARKKVLPKGVKSPTVKLMNTIFALKSFNVAEKSLEFKVDDPRDELNVKDMIRSSSAKPRASVARLSLLREEHQPPVDKRRKSFVISRGSSVEFSKKTIGQDEGSAPKIDTQPSASLFGKVFKKQKDITIQPRRRSSGSQSELDQEKLGLHTRDGSLASKEPTQSPPRMSLTFAGSPGPSPVRERVEKSNRFIVSRGSSPSRATDVVRIEQQREPSQDQKQIKSLKSASLRGQIHVYPLDTVSDGWKIMNLTIRSLADYIKRHSYLKIFSRDMVKRVMRIIEKKKDDAATKHMKDLEERYGKKIISIYNKGRRFVFMQSQNNWNGADIIIERAFLIGFNHYQFSKFKSSFTYATKLITRKPDLMALDPSNIPPVCDSSEFYSPLYEEKSPYWPLRNIITYSYYVYHTEALSQKVCRYVSGEVRKSVAEFQKLMADKMEEGIKKHGLLKLVSLINFRFEESAYLKGDFLADPTLTQISNILAHKVRGKIEWQLTNLFLSYAFFLYYRARKNDEKGYVVLSRSYDENKASLDIYLGTFVKYACARDQLHYFLTEPERRHPEPAQYPNISYTEFTEKLVNLESRIPFVYDLVENTLFECLTVSELKEILKAAGSMALQLNDFPRALMYYENYLFTLDSIDRVELHRFLVNGKIKVEKVDRILLLNKEYMKYSNYILKACFETQQYIKALTIIVNILFIFNNSLNLINYFDPHSHPTKKPNEIIMMDLKTFENISDDKKRYKSLMMFYIAEWRTAMDYHSKIWDTVSQVSNKDKFKQSFFLAFRESIDHVETLPLHNLQAYLAFVSRYTNLPTVLAKGDTELKSSDHLSLSFYEKNWQMDYYFPTYVGDFDKSFIETKILELIYMNSHNHNKVTRLTKQPSKKSGNLIMQDTESFKSKRVKKLHIDEVRVFYSLAFEDVRLSNALFRNIMMNYYIENEKYKESYIEFVDTALMNADQLTKAKLHLDLSKLQQHWRKELLKRDLEHQRLKNLKIVTWSDKFVKRESKFEDIENQNIIRSVERRVIGQDIHKPSRFFKEQKVQSSDVHINCHLNEYETQGLIRNPQSLKQTKTKRRPSLSRLCGITTQPVEHFDGIRVTINTEGFYQINNLIEDKQPKFKRVVPQLTTVTPTMKRKVYPSPNLQASSQRSFLSLHELANKNQFSAHLRAVMPPGKELASRSLSKLPKIELQSRLPVVEQSRASKGEATVVVIRVEDEDSKDSLERLVNVHEEPAPWPVESYGGELMLSFRSEFAQEGTEANYSLVDYSLRKIQQRAYIFKIQLPRTMQARFFATCSITGTKLTFTGYLRTSKSSSDFPFNFSFDFSKNIIDNKEEYLLAYNTPFQTYWPILFKQFKDDYLTKFYDLTKEQRKTILGPDQALYKYFVQNLGLGFDLSYTDFKEPLGKIKDRPEYSFYHRIDYHALQILNSNFEVMVRLLDSLIFRSLHGYNQRFSVPLTLMMEILTRKKLNLGVFQFKLTRTFNYLLRDTRRLEDRLLLRERYSTLQTDSSETHSSPRAYIKSVKMPDSPGDSSPSPSPKMFLASKTRAAREQEHSASQKIESFHECLEFMEIFSLKMQMVNLSRGNEKSDEFFLCRKMCNFFRIHPCLYSVDMKLIVHSHQIEENIEFFKKTITTFDQEIRVWEEFSLSKIKKKQQGEHDQEFSTSDLELTQLARNLRENFLIFVLFVFMEKTFEFELRSNHPFLDKVPHYKAKGRHEEGVNNYAHSQSKKYILRRNRFFKAEGKRKKISFLQLYFLGKPFSNSRFTENMLQEYLTSHEMDRKNFLDVWDFGLLANKDSILKELKQEFELGFQLNEEINIYKNSILRLFKSILYEPMNNRSLRALGLRAMERKQYLKCFLREKNLYHVLEFKDEETRLLRNEYSEYTFEYDKFHTYIQADKKLIESDIVQMIMKAIDPVVDDLISIKDLTLSIRIREFLAEEPQEPSVHKINSIGKVENSMIKIGEKAAMFPDKKFIRPLLGLSAVGARHGLTNLMRKVQIPEDTENAREMKNSRSQNNVEAQSNQKHQDEVTTKGEPSLDASQTQLPAVFGLKSSSSQGMIGLNQIDSALVGQVLQRRKIKANLMENLFGPTFEQIVSRNFLNDNLKTAADDQEQGLGDRLEVFSDSSDLISKSKLIYATSQYPVSSLIRKYYSLKDRNNLDLLKTIDPNATPYYTMLASLDSKVSSEWNINFNMDQDNLVRLFLEHWNSHKQNPQPFRLRKHFTSFGSKLLLSNSVYQPFNLLFLFDYTVAKWKEIPRVLIRRIEIHVYYLSRQAKIKLEVKDPYNILMLMRILRLKSDALQYSIFKQHFGHHLASYLAYGLKQSNNRFFKHQSAVGDPSMTTQISFLGIPKLDAVVMLPGFTKAPKARTELSLMSSSDLNDVEQSNERSRMNAVFPGGTACQIDNGMFDPKTSAEESCGFSPLTELRITTHTECESKAFKKPFGLGFVNPMMKKLIKQNRKESNLLNHTSDGLKYQISFLNEMTGSPVLYVPQYKHFQFYMNYNIKNLGEAYITANVFLILQRPATMSEQTLFEDVHTIRNHFLESIANRLKSLSKLFFKDSVITPEDLYYVKLQSARAKVRKALRLDEGRDLQALDHWSKTMSKIEVLLHQYSNSKPQAEILVKGQHQLLSKMWNLKEKQKQEDRLILPGEMMLFSFDMTPKNSRTCVHKIILSWNDIKKFFVNESFFKFIFPRIRSYKEGLQYFSKTTPKHLFMELLRFILSNCEVMKQRIYSAPIVLLDKEMTKQIYIKNTFSKFNKTQGSSSQKAAEMFSRNSQVVYQGVRRLGNQYHVITVMKNKRLRTFEMILYNPKYCREYSMTVQASTLGTTQVAFLAKLCKYINQLNLDSACRQFSDFDEKWSAVNKRGGAKSININSDTSILQGGEQVNDSALDPSDNQSMETSLLHQGLSRTSPSAPKPPQSPNFGWKGKSSQTPYSNKHNPSGFAAASDSAKLRSDSRSPSTTPKGMTPVGRSRESIASHHKTPRGGPASGDQAGGLSGAATPRDETLAANSIPPSLSGLGVLQPTDSSSPTRFSCLADVFSLGDNRLASLEDVLQFMQTYKQHFKTSTLAKIFHATEEDIFLHLRVSNARQKSGNVRTELFETPSSTLSFSLKLERVLAQSHKFLEVEVELS